MPLTYTGGTALNSNFAIGSNHTATLSFLSSVVIVGNVRFELGLWPILGTIPPAGTPTAYYEVAWPAANGTTVIMNNVQTEKHHNFIVRLTRVTTTTFNVAVHLLFTADWDTFYTYPANGNVLHTYRFTKDHFSNGSEFSNTAASIYSQTGRGIHFRATLVSTPTDTVTANIEYRARWFDKGLLNAAPEATFTKLLRRNGVPVTNLSAFQNTQFEWYVDTAGAAIDRFWVAVAKRSAVPESGTFLNSAKVHKVEILLAGTHVALDVIPNTAFFSSTVTLISGTYYKIVTTLTASYFENGQDYILMAGVKRAALVFENSTYLLASATEAAPITQGIITPESYTYDDASTLLNASCFINNVPYIRWRWGTKMLKQEYNDQLFAAGKPGSFNTNIQGVDIFISDIPPTDSGVPAGNILETLTTSFIDNPIERWYFVSEHRTPLSWAGVNRYIVFRWRFLVGGVQEHIYYPITVTTNPLGTQIALTSLQIGGQDVGAAICQDAGGTAIATLTDSSGNPGRAIAVVLPNDEEDGYGHVYLDQEGTDYLNWTDDLLNPVATLEIDTANLPGSGETCINVLKVPDTFPTPSAVCPCAVIALTQTTLTCNASICNIGVNAFANPPINNAIVSSFVLTGNINGVPVTASSTNTAIIATFQVPNSNTIIGSYQLVLMTTTGCMYTTIYNLQTSNVPNNSQTQNPQDCPCNPCYTQGNVNLDKVITGMTGKNLAGATIALSTVGIVFPVTVNNPVQWNNLNNQLQAWVTANGGGTVTFSAYDTVPAMFFANTCVKVLNYTCTGPFALLIPSTLLGSCQQCTYTVQYSAPVNQIYNATQGSDVSFAMPAFPYANDAAGALLITTHLQNIWNAQGYSGVWSFEMITPTTVKISVVNSGRQLTRIRVNPTTFVNFTESCIF